MSALTMAAFSSRSARAALSALDLGSRRVLLCEFVMRRPFIDSSLHRVLDSGRGFAARRGPASSCRAHADIGQSTAAWRPRAPLRVALAAHAARLAVLPK